MRPGSAEFNIVRIKNSQKVKELLSDRAEHERDARLERMARFGVPPRDIV